MHSRVKVFRQDNQNFTVNNIIVKDSMLAYFEFIYATANIGSFDINSGLWSNISLAGKDTATIEIKVRISNSPTFLGGQICNEAWLYAMGGTYYDSKAGNKVEFLLLRKNLTLLKA
jgi:hypothetical protein